MDLHLHLTHEVPGGMLVLTADAGQHKDGRLATRFEELSGSFEPTSSVRELQRQLTDEFEWNGFTSVKLSFIPQRGASMASTVQYIEERIMRPWGVITVKVELRDPADTRTETQVRASIRDHAATCGPNDKGSLEQHLMLTPRPGLSGYAVDFQPYTVRVIDQQRVPNGGMLQLKGRLLPGAKLDTAQREAFLTLARGFTPTNTPAENVSTLGSLGTDFAKLLPAGVFTKLSYVPPAPVAATAR